MEAPTIRCANCGTELNDPPEAVKVGGGGRLPCPRCGSTDRSYAAGFHDGLKLTDRVDVVVRPATVRARASVPTPTVRVSDQTQRRADELAVGTTVRSLVWHDRNEDGDVFVEARDEEGNILGVNVGSDLDDAILNLADQLKPPAGDA